MSKSKQTKKMLLMSVISLILCFSMLLGTTFAWFTDSVESGINQIKAGNLDIELEYWNGSAWATVHGEDQLFTGNLWEPGHTEIVYLRLSNLGSLALKYQLGMNIVSETGSVSVKTNEEFKLSQFIQYGVVKDQQPSFADRTAAVKALNGQSDPLAKPYAINGAMLATDEPLYLALVVYMPETVGNEANHKTGEAAPTIELGINLVATQFTYEKDSFDELYDKGANASMNRDGIIYVYDGVDIILSEVTEEFVGDTIIVPEGVTVIGDSVLENDTRIKYIQMASTIRKLGYNAFKKSAIETAVLNEGLEQIDEFCFNQSLALKSVNIPSTVKSIGKNAFRTIAVETLVIPANVTHIAEGAFRDLTEARVIIIEGSPEIANFAFRSCKKLESVVIKGENTTFLGGGQVFTHADTGLGKINVYVPNEAVKDGLLAATSQKDTLNITVGNLATIGSAEELMAMNAMLNGTAAFFGRAAAPNVFLLTADIDMAGHSWTPIANFSGIFDGLGFGISNLSITGTNRVGFFGRISGAKVQNVTFANAQVTGNHYVGVVFGWEGSESVWSNVSNVTVTGSSVAAATINGDDGDKVGGIGGYAVTTVIDNCTVENTVISAYRDAGGILGFANQTKGANATKVTNNTVKNLTLLWNSEVNYKNYTSVAEADLNPVVGEQASKALVENNTDDSRLLKLEYDAKSGLYFNGKATWGTYYIFNAADLQKAAAYFVHNTNTSEGNICNIELMADIDLSGIEWNAWTVMWINFNGNGHTISNIHAAEGWRSGFFGYIGAAKINDLTLENVTATGAQAGTFAGSAEGLTVNNCFLKGENAVTYKEYASETYTETWGGIGAITGVLAECTINAEIAEGATVQLNKGNMLTNCAYIDKFTGYLNANKGEIVNNGQITVTAANADNLVAALEKGEDVVLTDDVKIDPAGMSNAYGKTGITVKNGQTIDGGGNVLDIKGAGGTWDSGINTTGGLIKNITVTGSFRGIFINHNSDYSERVVLENVIIDGTVYTISCDQGKNQGLTATNSTFNGWTSYAATLGEAEFIDCSFGEGSGYAFCRPYAPTAFVGCDFEAGFQMDPRAAVTFENCTVGGEKLTAENLFTLVTSNIANATVK